MRAYVVMFCIGLMSLALAGCKMHFDKTTDTFVAKESPGSVENGKNLVFNVCGSCHYDEKSAKFIGQSLNDLPKIAGHLYSANLTQSREFGRPPKYSDAELFYLLKTGISRSGYFMPFMMKPMMADQDINDIIVYLRSNDKAVAAADTLVGRTRINAIGKMGIRAIAKPQPYNKGVQKINRDDAVSYGRYLVGIIGCYHCHSKKAAALDYLDAEKSKGYLAGGMKLKGENGKKIRASNITAAGIASYREEDFRKALTQGVSASGRQLRPPMPKFDHLRDDQVHAIFTYLKTVQPLSKP
jgi:mono/diheme cytochrome c family protein